MLGSLSENTIKQYGITYRFWWEYCESKNISPFDAEIPAVISFFQNILDSTKNIFGSFNSHRAALSLISSRDLGENPQIKRFLKGVFKMRPPKPKYNCTWDPQLVLNYLKNSTESNLKFISCKLVSLLTLATGERLQTISLIKCSYILFSNTGVTILIPDLVKTSRPNFCQPSLCLPYFEQNSKLCVASTLKDYLDATRTLRRPDQDSLFITYSKPHGTASKQTLSRWVKSVLQAAGVDITKFKAHSTRHAATSSAFRKGVSIDVIKKSAGWSKESSTFGKFYNRPLVTSTNEFQDRVLNLE